MLHKKDLLSSPFEQFEKWYLEHLTHKTEEPQAMSLATANAQGQPGLRTVLLKKYDRTGFTFFTNYHSRKAHDLDENPRAALLFYWPHLKRQIRIEGQFHKIPAEESRQYFATRPIESQIGAWASDQSHPIENRSYLEKKYADFKEKFGSLIPLPPHWGGYQLIPERFEFWQAGFARLHDSFSYTLIDGQWQINRLAA